MVRVWRSECWPKGYTSVRAELVALAEQDQRDRARDGASSGDREFTRFDPVRGTLVPLRFAGDELELTGRRLRKD